MFKNRKKSMTSFLLIGAAGFVALGLIIWQAFARRTFTELKSNLKEQLADVTSRLDRVVLPDGKVQAEIPYFAALSLGDEAGKAKAGVQRIAGDLESGRGMSFWFHKSRNGEAEAARARLSLAESVGQKCRLILKNLEPAVERVPGLIGAAVKARQATLATLRADNEGGDLGSLRADLELLRDACAESLKKLETAETARDDSPEAEPFRRGIVRGLGSRLIEESNNLGACIKVCGQAEAELDQLKAEIQNVLSRDSGILGAVESLAASVAPAVREAKRWIDPVERVLDRLNQPIGASEFTWGSIAETFVPSVGPTISTTRALISALENAQTTIDDLLRVTVPLNEAIGDFSGSGSRESILRVIASSKAGASFFASKVGLFDPILSRTAEAKEAVFQIAGHRLFADKAQVIINLIQTIESPYEQGKAAILDLSRSLGGLETLNARYADAVSRMASGLPGVIPGESWPVDASAQNDSDRPGIETELGQADGTIPGTQPEEGEQASLTAPLEDGSALDVMSRWMVRDCVRFVFDQATGAGFSSLGPVPLSGTLRGGWEWRTAEGRNTVQGAKSVLHFDGRSGFARLNEHPITQGPLTVALWVRKTGPGRGPSPAMIRANAPGSAGGYCLYWFDPNTIQALICTDSSNASLIYEGAPLDTWVHIAMTYDLSRTRLYVNGRLVKVAEQHGQLNTPNWPLSIGGQGGGWDDSYFQGEVADLLFCNRALDPGEIETVYRGDIATSPRERSVQSAGGK